MNFVYNYAGRPFQNQLVKPQVVLYNRLANMFTNRSSSGSERIEAVGKAVDLYQSCMDAAAIERLGATPLLNLIRDSLGKCHAYMHECNLN
jgi:uncharacterized protein VirK/YbjX